MTNENNYKTTIYCETDCKHQRNGECSLEEVEMMAGSSWNMYGGTPNVECKDYTEQEEI